ncbi:uncharacterized protein LOC116849140 isoform X2 [Odontomachus brunneus]|uniref:uncharacterized protein LOC116849140 isoform X2 n=1 Tax=Odontomachus brunneus TaxID=486640 RepID=UPI0013F2494E|nr:uncharacterized protein LOC116849140 isoform X2 [Odontomachus brunneus]
MSIGSAETAICDRQDVSSPRACSLVNSMPGGAVSADAVPEDPVRAEHGRLEDMQQNMVDSESLISQSLQPNGGYGAWGCRTGGSGSGRAGSARRSAAECGRLSVRKSGYSFVVGQTTFPPLQSASEGMCINSAMQCPESAEAGRLKTSKSGGISQVGARWAALGRP